MIDLKHKSILMYVVLKQKSVFLAIEMRLTSLALKFKLSEFKNRGSTICLLFYVI